MNYRLTKAVRPFTAARTQWSDDYAGGPLYLPDGYGNSLNFLAWDCYARAGTFHDNRCIGKQIWWYDSPWWRQSFITDWYSTAHVAVADNQGDTGGYPYVTRWGRLAASVADLALWLQFPSGWVQGLRDAGYLDFHTTTRWGLFWSTWDHPSDPWLDWPLTIVTL